MASEAKVDPAVSYIEHAGSQLSSGSLGLNDPRAEGPSIEPTLSGTPVAMHAMAPALPAPAPTLAPAVVQSEEDEEALEGRPLSELVAEFASRETTDEETDCLARAVYFESKGEPLTGQLTVAEVIINRAESGRFPSTICGVVRQRGQFSFVRGGRIPTPPPGSRDWRTAVGVAHVAMRDLADGGAPRALFFHARHVRPGWRLTRVATVGNHIFYR
ncbi:cell wall hydrolase [Sphingosinicella sp. CPCC 101087]|uniref:cell wall hydrolase n=1 Tax=Sphingosinicella sp. CPCC 101087 TaxID=2497754 RepID=UPI00101C5A8D|nr:cell wall hydrolase [Sphingosinicella sp. CPCC 101087]